MPEFSSCKCIDLDKRNLLVEWITQHAEMIHEDIKKQAIRLNIPPMDLQPLTDSIDPIKKMLIDSLRCLPACDEKVK